MKKLPSALTRALMALPRWVRIPAGISLIAGPSFFLAWARQNNPDEWLWIAIAIIGSVIFSVVFWND